MNGVFRNVCCAVWLTLLATSPLCSQEIDRELRHRFLAAVKETVIGKGCKISDQVAIGHGVRMGPGCLLVPKVAISGSVKVGHHCVFGGQVGVVGHIKIGNMVRVGAQAGVIGDVPDGTTIMGSPAVEAGRGRRAYALIETLPDMRKKLRSLDKRIGKLEPVDEK